MLPTELPIELAIDTTDVRLATPPAVTLPIKLETLFDASAPSAAQGFEPGGKASLIDCTHCSYAPPLNSA